VTRQKLLLFVLLLGKIFPEDEKLKIILENLYFIFDMDKINLLKITSYIVLIGFLFLRDFGISFASSWLYK
jgi:hypothetical protein